MPFKPGQSGNPAGQFKPGRSGNPGGRAKDVYGVKELARQQGAASIETMIAIRDNPKVPPATRLAAAMALLDRGYGRAEQHQTTEAIARNIVRVPQVAASAEEWMEIARRGGYGKLDGPTEAVAEPAVRAAPGGDKVN